jgi:hypothetical protein
MNDRAGGETAARRFPSSKRAEDEEEDEDEYETRPAIERDALPQPETRDSKLETGFSSTQISGWGVYCRERRLPADLLGREL